MQPSANAPVGEPGHPEKGGPWLSRNLVVLSAVSFLQDSASELLYPVLPYFLTVTLGAPVAVVGAVEGVAEGAASFAKLASGRLADRRSKRPPIAVGYGMAAAGKLLIAVAGAWPVVLTGRVVDRLGKGVRGAPRDALLTVDVPVGYRGRVFGLHRTADTAGAVAGPLLGLAAYELLGRQIRPLLFVAVVPALASVALVRAVRERPTPTEALTSSTALSRRTSLPRPFWRVVSVLILFGLLNFPDALLLLRVQQLSHSLMLVVLVYAAYNASYAVLSYPAGSLADRYHPRLVFGVGLLCFAVTYAGLGVTRDLRWVWALLLLYGGFTAATDGVGKAWISGLVPGGLQGRAQGTYSALSGGAVLVAGLWAGFAWGGTGRLPLLLSGGGAAALAAVILLRPGEWLRK